MSSLQRIYAETLHENFPIYYANFPPNDPAQLGDFGTLIDGVFKRIASLKEQFGLSVVSAKAAKEGGKFEFTSKGGVGIENRIGAEVSVAARREDIAASVSISFSAANAVFFSAAGCKSLGLQNELPIRQSMLELFLQGHWKPEWVTVIGLVEAQALTLLVSGEKGARIELESTASAQIDFGKLQSAAGLRVASEKSMAHKWVSEKSTTPFLRLAAVRRKRIFGKPEVHTEFMAEPSPDDLAHERDKLLNDGRSLSEMFEVRPIEGDEHFGW